MNTSKDVEYAAILTAKISEVFEEDIDKKELLEGENLTHFFHALVNLMPNHIYNTLTGDDKNNLEFNHLANNLVFQYSKPKQ